MTSFNKIMFEEVVEIAISEIGFKGIKAILGTFELPEILGTSKTSEILGTSRISEISGILRTLKLLKEIMKVGVKLGDTAIEEYIVVISIAIMKAVTNLLKTFLI